MKTIDVRKLYNLLKAASMEQVKAKEIMAVVTSLRALRPLAEQSDKDIEAAQNGIFTEEMRQAQERYNELNKSHTPADLAEMASLRKKLDEANRKLNEVVMEILEKDVEVTLTKLDTLDTLIASNKSWKGEDMLIVYDNLA